MLRYFKNIHTAKIAKNDPFNLIYIDIYDNYYMSVLYIYKGIFLSSLHPCEKSALKKKYDFLTHFGKKYDFLTHFGNIPDNLSYYIYIYMHFRGDLLHMSLLDTYINTYYVIQTAIQNYHFSYIV